MVENKIREKLLSVEGRAEDRWAGNHECRVGRQAELVGHCVGHRGCRRKDLCLQMAVCLWHETCLVLVC